MANPNDFAMQPLEVADATKQLDSLPTASTSSCRPRRRTSR